MEPKNEDVSNEEAEVDELAELCNSKPRDISAEEDMRTSTQRDINEDEDYPDDSNAQHGVCQWTISSNIYIPTSKTKIQLQPGVYEIKSSPQTGIYFELIQISTEDILRLPDSNSVKVIQEIENFWEREKHFKQFKFTYKRGILLWGPPGSGKTSVVKLATKDIVDRGGIVVKFEAHPSILVAGLRLFRQIQPDTPIIILMEDLDEILRCNNESQVINILDGVDMIDKVLFLATTNYPEDIGPRVVNRPSRFDKRYKIPMPSDANRMAYFEFIFQKYPELKCKYDLEKWVADTKNLSIAHLKELFISVVVMEYPYDLTIKTLQNMKEQISSEQDGGKKGVGFGRDHEDDDDY